MASPQVEEINRKLHEWTDMRAPVDALFRVAGIWDLPNSPGWVREYGKRYEFPGYDDRKDVYVDYAIYSQQTVMGEVTKYYGYLHVYRGFPIELWFFTKPLSPDAVELLPEGFKTLFPGQEVPT